VQTGIQAVKMGGIVDSDAAPGHIYYNLTLLDLAGPGDPLDIDASAGPAIVECNLQRVYSIHGGRNGFGLTYFSNVNAQQFGVSNTASTFGIEIQGGILQGGSLNSCLITDDTIVGTSTSIFGSTAGIGAIFVDQAATQIVTGGLVSITAPLYGRGTLNVGPRSTVTYPAGAGGAVANMPLANGIIFNGVRTAYGNVTSAGNTTVFNRATSAAAMDAASGLATGFGGFAYVPGVCALTNGTQT
jgi:hypothetical protein